MNSELKSILAAVQTRIDALPINEFLLSSENQKQRNSKVDQIIEDELRTSSHLRSRVKAEFDGLGPLESLLQDADISEILVNGPECIWIEKNGQLQNHDDGFWSELTYRNALERICNRAKVQITVENPCADGSFENFRLSLIGAEVTQKNPHLSLRRHPENPWTFEKLIETGWCPSSNLELFQKIISQRKNFLVIGSTGSGKTSVLNSFLSLLSPNERVVSIEDTSEISLPNTASMKLLTREDANGILNSIDQTQLVKRALRLRPDRIAMGEVRGAEAKDFLMALATGHSGSFGTLHAKDPHQALIRLEMLIQMGAPQWSLQAIRRLIQLSLDCIVVTEKAPTGQRLFRGAYQITSLEEHGFLLEKMEIG